MRAPRWSKLATADIWIVHWLPYADREAKSPAIAFASKRESEEWMDQWHRGGVERERAMRKVGL